MCFKGGGEKMHCSATLGSQVIQIIQSDIYPTSVKFQLTSIALLEYLDLCANSTTRNIVLYAKKTCIWQLLLIS